MKPLFIAFCLVILPLYGEWANQKEGGPVHDAFVTKTGGDIFLQAYDKEPPKPINERIPEQKDPNTQWIHGYWDWDDETEDFVWVCGVWRKVPPGLRWTRGFWTKEEEGWIRVPGFWSDENEANFDYLSEPPPDQINEESDKAPSSEMFWIPGYWQWDQARRTYSWLSGKWEKFDKDWVLVPAHYIWRPEGYLLVPSYWDYPIDNRGTTYHCLDIPTNVRDDYIYTPSGEVSPTVILEKLFCCYPDYIHIYHHHYNYNPNYWTNNPWTPPWWGWDSWWRFTPNDQWGLWWWWSHPGYSQPYWFTSNYAGLIGPPPRALVDRFRRFRGPIFITNRGVVNFGTINNFIRNRNNRPVFHRNARREIDDRAGERVRRPDKILHPEGKGDTLRKNKRDQLPLPIDSVQKPDRRQPGSQRVPQPPRRPIRPEVNLPRRPIIPPQGRRPRLDQDQPPQRPDRDVQPIPPRPRLPQDERPQRPRRERLDQDDRPIRPRRERLDRDDRPQRPRRERLDQDDQPQRPRRERLDQDGRPQRPRRERPDRGIDMRPDRPQQDVPVDRPRRPRRQRPQQEIPDMGRPMRPRPQEMPGMRPQRPAGPQEGPDMMMRPRQRQRPGPQDGGPPMMRPMRPRGPQDGGPPMMRPMRPRQGPDIQQMRPDRPDRDRDRQRRWDRQSFI